LFLATEMNGARLHEFAPNGRIISEPVATNEDFYPDMISPTVSGSLILGGAGSLMCLNVDRGLQTAWESYDDHYADYFSVIVGNGHILITSIDGWLHLLKEGAQKHHLISRVDLFPDVPEKKRITWSHPALVGDLYFIRNQANAYCFQIGTSRNDAPNKSGHHEPLEQTETLP